MIRLSEVERDISEGRQGRLKQVCLENIARYAEILGADELCKITKATVFCGAHNYREQLQSDYDRDQRFRKN